MGLNGNYVGISCGNVDLMGCNGNIVHIGNFLRQGMDRHFLSRFRMRSRMSMGL